MLIDSGNLERQVENFKKKFYVSLLLKGAILSIGILLSVFIIISSAEFFGRFNSAIRLSLLISFSLVFLFLCYKYIYYPILSILGIKKILTDEKAAKNIGEYYPQIADKLLNILQLKSNSNTSELVNAAYLQRKNDFSTYNFEAAIESAKNKKYFILIALPFISLVSLYLLIPNFFKDSTNRIYHFNKEFKVQNPFSFTLIDYKGYAIKGEDVKIKVKINGTYLTSDATIALGANVYPLIKINSNEYNYTIKNIQTSTSIIFNTGSFDSEVFQINVLALPSISELSCKLTFPAYLHRKEERLINSGNLIVPEGTQIEWVAKSNLNDVLKATFDNKEIKVINNNDGKYNFSKRILNSQTYSIQLHHKEYHSVTDSMTYQINCIKDAFPSIELLPINDSSVYKKIDIAGSISDDYGISSLKVVYQIINKSGNLTKTGNLLIPFNDKNKDQKFYFSWTVDSLITDKEELKYYIAVSDNDGVNGAKTTKSQDFKFEKASKDALQEKINSETKESVSDIKSLKSKSDNNQNKLNNLEDRLKSKSTLSWQDKKEISSLIKENKDNNNKIEDLKKQLQDLTEKKNQLEQRPSNELEQKIENLNELMNQLLDEETKKLYEKLEQLLNEQGTKNELDKVIKNLAMKEENFNNEVSKLLEMFKEIQLEEKLDAAINQIEKLAEKQLNQAEKMLEDKKSEKADQLKEEQKTLNSEFDKAKNDLKEIQKLNSELENKKPIPEQEEALKEISKQQNTAQESLENKKNKQAADAAKKAGESMKDLANQMAESNQKDQEQQQEENIKDLRMILENLVQLSFDQEDVLKGFKKTSNVDPQYVALSQKQLKVKTDSKVISDSLLALSKRVFEIKSFVTRELTSMNAKIEESIEAIKARRQDQTLTKQQFAMSSMNNLALMLDDVLNQMQNQMAESKKAGNKSCSKPGKKPGKNPGLSDLQKKLGKQMQEMMKAGKLPGKEMSEALAKMAAQQEYIRKALQQLEKNQKGGKKPGSELDNLSKEMEKNEEDWVNKKFNQQQLQRQQEILTRLLESEKAQKERDLEETRTAEQALERKNNSAPKSIDDFMMKKQSEIDLLRTLPPSLNQFYKKESGLYFNNIQ